MKDEKSFNIYYSIESLVHRLGSLKLFSYSVIILISLSSSGFSAKKGSSIEGNVNSSAPGGK